jgi:hypothetical protein
MPNRAMMTMMKVRVMKMRISAVRLRKANRSKKVSKRRKRTKARKMANDFIVFNDSNEF